MEPAGASAVVTRFLARPGRQVIVVTDLGMLRGPVSGGGGVAGAVVLVQSGSLF